MDVERLLLRNVFHNQTVEISERTGVQGGVSDR